MTTTISNLPRDMIEDILSRVPLKSLRAVRLTCKNWNTLSKSPSFSKMRIAKAAAATKESESMMITMMDYNLHLMSIVVNENPSKESKGKLTCLDKQVKISKVFHCEGLLLCILKDDDTRVVVWNPYCGQTRWIRTRFSDCPNGWDLFRYAIGYEDKKSCRSFKLLRFIDYYQYPLEKQFFWYEIYDFDSDLWTTLDVNPHWRISFHAHGVSLKGNTYWCAKERNTRRVIIDNIICFDFTRERFGPLLPLPSSDVHIYDDVTLHCVREERLAALFQNQEYGHHLEIWITTKIEAEKMSWSKFLRVDTELNIKKFPFIKQGFFIDEEKKVVMGFDSRTFIIIGENGYFRKLHLREHAYQDYCRPQVCSYVPSLVQIKKPTRGKRKKQSILEERRFDQNMLRLTALAEYSAAYWPDLRKMIKRVD